MRIADTKQAAGHSAPELGELPEGWASCTMGEIADVIGGGTPKAADASNFSEAGHAWITPADLSGFDGMYILRGRRDLSERGLRSCAARLMPPGTVLMSSRAPIGYLAIATNTLSTNQGFKSFVCHGDIVPEYVYFWLRFARPLVEDMGSGSTFAEVSGSRAQQIPIVLAPTAEQKRVAAKVEELLARVNATRDRLRRVPAILKAFRQAVLAAACSGRLTADWRDRQSESQTGSALLSQILEMRRAILDDQGRGRYRVPRLELPDDLPQLPDQWAWVTVECLSTKVVDGVHKKPVYVDRGIPFVTVRNLTAGPGISFEELNYISEADHQKFIERADPELGDILVSKDGTLGVVRAVRTEQPFSIFVSVALIKPVLREMTDYLELALCSPPVQRQMVGTGSGLQHIHLRDLRADCVPLPSLAEQCEIVRRVDALFRLADAIEKRGTAATTRAEKLTQAILAKAFRGELVPTEAELARREGRDYEPASVLLERVQREREATVDGRKRKR